MFLTRGRGFSCIWWSSTSSWNSNSDLNANDNHNDEMKHNSIMNIRSSVPAVIMNKLESYVYVYWKFSIIESSKSDR